MINRMRRLRRVASWVALAYAVYALLVIYGVPPLAKHLTETRVSALLQRPVTVAGISLNPFTLCLQVHRLEVWEADGETLFAGVGHLEANLDLLLSVLQRGLVVSAVSVDGPHAVVVRRPDGSLNLSDLVRARPAAPPAPPSGPPRFSVSNIQIREGWFVFRDEVVKAQQRLTGVHLSLAAVSSLPNYTDVYVRPAFRAHLNGREIAIDCQTKPFADSQESTGSIRLDNLDLTPLARYLPEPRTFDVASGYLDINLRLNGLHVFGKKPSVAVSGDIGLRDLRLNDRSGLPLAGVGALRLSLLPTDLLQGEVHLRRIVCTAPFLRLERNAEGSLVLPRLGPTSPAAAAAAPAPPAGVVPQAAPAARADIDSIEVSKGRLEFNDATLSPVFSTALDFALQGTGMSTRPERAIQVRIEAATESNETLEGTYTVTLFPLLSVTGTTVAKGVRLPKYMPYLQSTLASTVTRGTLALSVAHEIALPAGAPPVVKISDLDLGVSDFCLSAGAEQAPVIAVRELALTNVTADLGTREAVVGSFVTRGGQVHLQRYKDGSLNLQKLLRPSPPPANPSAAAVPTPASAPAPWTVTVRDAVLTQWAVALDDERPGTPVHLAIGDITLAAKGLSTRAGQRGTLALGLRLNESAALAVTGAVCAQPLALDLALTLTDLALKDFQGYVADHLKLLISDGTVAADLKVVVTRTADSGLDGTMDGSFALRRFASVDQAHAADFVKAGELALRGIHVALRPLAVDLDEVALGGLDTALTVEPDGTLNLLSVLGITPAPAPGAAAPVPAAPAPAPERGAAFPLRIGTIRLDGCGLVFTDQRSAPHYRVALGDVAGTVTGFTLDRPTPAQVDLAGRFDGQAPFALKATFKDLGPQMTLSASTTLRDFELSPVTPYSGRYVGYAVQKGKLNFDLQYTLTQRQLVAEHKIKIDQFAFGQKVDSPDATDLPVRLAVALLKDRKGQINLDVPVRGSLDDPEFSVLRIVLKVLRDLVAKAAVSPFAMLGALVGGGEELSFVAFEPGSADLDEAAVKKLELLAKAMLDRPDLQVETGGAVDPATDREGLRHQAVVRQIKARRLADLVKAGTPVGSVDEVTLAPPERDAYLLKIYRETLAPAPATPPAPQPLNAPEAAATPPEPTPAEIERQLLERTTVAPAEVNLLAGRRAARVREFLTTIGQVAPERVFVVDSAPPPAAGASAADTPSRQARMSLR